jgi:hypothetical protein
MKTARARLLRASPLFDSRLVPAQFGILDPVEEQRAL